MWYSKKYLREISGDVVSYARLKSMTFYKVPSL